MKTKRGGLRGLLALLKCWPNAVDQRTTGFTSVYNSLPKDIIIDILYRLPPDSVLACTKVFPSWHNTVTCEPSFAEAHLRLHGTKILASLTSHPYLHGFDLRVMEGFGRNTRLIKGVNVGKSEQLPQYYFNSFVGSCNGLLLFHTTYTKPSSYIIFNPFTKKGATVKTPDGVVSGFFFDGVTNEYKFLLHHLINGHKLQIKSKYFLYGLKSKSTTKVGKSRFYPNIGIDTSDRFASLARAIFWLGSPYATVGGAESADAHVMMFNLDNHQFSSIPFPTKYHNRWIITRLMEVDGELLLTDVDFEDWAVQIWVLKDFSNRIWVTKSRIDLNRSFKDAFPGFGSTEHRPYKILLLDIQNDGDLLLSYSAKGFFWYNKQLRIAKRIPKASRVSRMVSYKAMWLYRISVVKYVKSFVSPKHILS